MRTLLTLSLLLACTSAAQIQSAVSVIKLGDVISKHSAKPPVTDDKRPTDPPAQAAARAILEAHTLLEWDTYGFAGPPKEIDGRTETVAVSVINTIWDESFPPTALVVVGSIVDGDSFVTAARHSVYSDFHVRVEEVLRQDKDDPARAGDVVTTWRSGGAIRFASGHVMNFVIYGKGFPVPGERYVLFLSRWPDIRGRYEIRAGYQLAGGVAQGLDDGGPYSAYDNVPEIQFMKTVRAAVAGRKGVLALP